VAFVLNLLRADMLRTMRLTGCGDVRELDQRWVARHRASVRT
jgi:isopentenyl diphosphate isomerase/L-lactate dehydrogenase-like FMN-dependent dehydrogenase